MYKFRSMRLNGEEVKKELDTFNELDGPVFKIRRDPRVTPVGRFLRRLSLDELPQLYNVLRGDMSIVGPRPPLPEEVERYERWQRRRLSMKPGLTCIWQVSGRNALSFDEMVRLDLAYVVPDVNYFSPWGGVIVVGQRRDLDARAGHPDRPQDLPRGAVREGVLRTGSCRLFLEAFHACEDFHDLGPQLRHLPSRDVPHDVVVNPEVVVDELVANPCHRSPFDLRMRRPDGGGHLLCRLADDF